MKTNPCKTCNSPFHTAMYHKRQPLQTKLHCSFCDSTKHMRSQCPERAKTLRSVVPTHKPDPETGRYPDIKRNRHHLSKNGKYAKLWNATRAKWIKENPPDYRGYYYCHYCSVALPVNEMTLDHMESRTRRPDLRFELSNLVPSCMPHNSEKGSKSHDEIPHHCQLQSA